MTVDVERRRGSAAVASLRAAVPEGTVFLESGIGGKDSASELDATLVEIRARMIPSVNEAEPWWVQIVKSVILFAIAVQIVPIVLLAERKLLGRFQHRYGPNRVGPFGAAQPLADIIKLATKEDFRPSTSVGFLYALAPIISIVTAFAAFAILPFGNQSRTSSASDVGLYGLDVGIGVLYVFAFGAIAFYGLMLGGWASGSKYSFLGAMRAAAQLISYEVAMGLSLVGVLMMAGTLSLPAIVEASRPSGTSCRSSSASSSSSCRRSRRPTARRSTSPRPTPSSSRATTRSTAARSSRRTSSPST